MLVKELKILLLPEDINDKKNVIVEIEPVSAVMKQGFLQRNF